MGGDRALCSELAQRVAMEAEVFRRAASIQPHAVVVGVIGVVARHQAIGHEVREATQDVIDQNPSESPAVAAVRTDVWSWERKWSPRGSRSEVAYACIVGTSFKGSGQAPGCCTTAGAAL